MVRLRIQAALENKNSKEITIIEDCIEILKLIRENDVHATSFISRYNTWSSNFHINLEKTNSAKENSLKSIHPSYFMRFLATAFFTLCVLESVRCKNPCFLDVALTFCITLLIMNFISVFVLLFSASPNHLVKTMILYSSEVKSMFSDFKLRLNRAGRKFEFLPRPSELFIVNNFIMSLSLRHLILTPLSSLSEWYLLHGSVFSAYISIIFYVLDYETVPQIDLVACSLLLLLALLQDRNVRSILAEIKLRLMFLESECMNFLLWFEEECYLKRLLEESGFYKSEILQLFNQETEESSFFLKKPLLCFVTFFVAAESCLPADLHFLNLYNIVSFILYGTCNPNVRSYINIVSVSNKGASDSKTPKIHSLDSLNMLQHKAFFEKNIPQECSLDQIPRDTHEEQLDKRNGNEIFPKYVTSSPQVFLADERSSRGVENQFSCGRENEVLNGETGICGFENRRENPLVQEDQIFTNHVNSLNPGITFPTSNEFTCDECLFPKANTLLCTSASKQDDSENKKYDENVLLSNLSSSSSFFKEEAPDDDPILKTKNDGIATRSNAIVRTETDELMKDEQAFQPFAKEITHSEDLYSSHSDTFQRDSVCSDLGGLEDQAKFKNYSAEKYMSEVSVGQNYKLQSQNDSKPEDMLRNTSTVAERLQPKDYFSLKCLILPQQSEEDIKNSGLVNDGSQLLAVRDRNEPSIIRDEPITHENGQNLKTQALNYSEYLQNEETSEFRVQNLAVLQQLEEAINNSDAVCEGKQLVAEQIEKQHDIIKEILLISGIVNSREDQEFSQSDDTFDSKIKQSAVFQVVESEKCLNVSEEANDHGNYLGTVNETLQKSKKNTIDETPDRLKLEDFRSDEYLQSDGASESVRHSAGRRYYHTKVVPQAECQEKRKFENISANVTPNDVSKQELTCDDDQEMNFSHDKEVINIALNSDSAHFKYNGRTRDSEIKVKNSYHLKNQSSFSDTFDAANGNNTETDGKKALDDISTTTFPSDYEENAPIELKLSDTFTSDDSAIDSINQEITEGIVSQTVNQCPEDHVKYEIRSQSENKAELNDELELDSVMNRMEALDFNECIINQDEQIQISKTQISQNCVSEDQTSFPVAEVETQTNVLSKSVSDFNQETSYESAVSFLEQGNKCNDHSFSSFCSQDENNTSTLVQRILQNLSANSRIPGEEVKTDLKNLRALNLGTDTSYADIDEFMKVNQKPDKSINTATYINSGNNGYEQAQEISNRKELLGMDSRQIRRPFDFGQYANEQNTDDVSKLDQKFNTFVNSSVYINSNYGGAQHREGISTNTANPVSNTKGGEDHNEEISNKERNDGNNLPQIRDIFVLGQQFNEKKSDEIITLHTNNTKDWKKHTQEISNKEGNKGNILQRIRRPLGFGQQFNAKKTDEIVAMHVSNTKDGQEHKQEISNKEENGGSILQPIRPPFVFEQQFNEKKIDEIVAMHVSNIKDGREHKQEISNKEKTGGNILQPICPPFVFGQQFNEKKTHEILAMHVNKTKDGQEHKQEISNKEENGGSILQPIRRPFVFGQQFNEKKTDEIVAVHISNSKDGEEHKQEISNKGENEGNILQPICRPFIFEREAREKKMDKLLEQDQKYNKSANIAMYLNSTNNADERHQKISNIKENVEVAKISLQRGNECNSPTEAAKKGSKCRKRRKANRHCKNESISKSEENFNFGVTDYSLLQYSSRSDEIFPTSHCSLTAGLMEEKSDHLRLRKFNETGQNTSQEPGSRFKVRDWNAVSEFNKTELDVEGKRNDKEMRSDRKSSPKKRCLVMYSSATDDEETDDNKLENQQVSLVKENRLEKTLILIRNILNDSKTRKFTVFDREISNITKLRVAFHNRKTKHCLIPEFNSSENCIVSKESADQKAIESAEDVPFMIKNSELSERGSDKDLANQTPSLDNSEWSNVSKGHGNNRENTIVRKSMEDESVTLKNEKVFDSANPRIPSSTEKEIGKQPECSSVFSSAERENGSLSSTSLPAGSSEDENFHFHKSTSVCSESSEGVSADSQTENSLANNESACDLLDADVSGTLSLDQTCVTEISTQSNSRDSLLNASRSSVGNSHLVNHTHNTVFENEPKCKIQGGHMAWNSELCGSVENNLISESNYSGSNEMMSSQSSRQNFQRNANSLRYQLNHDDISLEFLDEQSEVTLRIISENDSERANMINLLEKSRRKLKFDSTENIGELLITEKKSENKETAFVDYSGLPFEINNENISILVDAAGELQPKISCSSSNTYHSSSSGWSTMPDDTLCENAQLPNAVISESKNELKQKDTESDQNPCLKCVEPECQINGTSSTLLHSNESCDPYLLHESPAMSHLQILTESQHQSDKNRETQQKITDAGRINSEELSMMKINSNLMDDVLSKTTNVIAQDYQQQIDKEQCENKLLPPIVDKKECGLNIYENNNVSKTDIQNISQENIIQTESLLEMKQIIENVSEDNMSSNMLENSQHPICLHTPIATTSADIEPSSVSSLCSSDLTNRNLCLESDKLKFNFTPKPDSGMLEMKYRHAPGMTTLVFKSEKEKLYLKIKDPILP